MKISATVNLGGIPSVAMAVSFEVCSSSAYTSSQYPPENGVLSASISRVDSTYPENKIND